MICCIITGMGDNNGGAKKKVLIVEDSKKPACEFERWMSHFDVDYVIVQDARSAGVELRKMEYDVIVCDLQFPPVPSGCIVDNMCVLLLNEMYIERQVLDGIHLPSVVIASSAGGIEPFIELRNGMGHGGGTGPETPGRVGPDTFIVCEKVDAVSELLEVLGLSWE